VVIGCGSPSTLTLQAFWWWVRPGSFGVVARSDVGCLPAAHSIRSPTPTVFSHTARSHTTPFPPIQTRLAVSLLPYYRSALYQKISYSKKKTYSLFAAASCDKIKISSDPGNLTDHQFRKKHRTLSSLLIL